MRLTVALLFLSLSGCGIVGQKYAEERETCDAYIDCVSEANPEATAIVIDQYGEASSCWDNKDQAAACAKSCEVSVAAVAVEAPDAGSCHAAAFGDCDATLSEESFEQQFIDRMCAESNSCGTSSEIAEIWCDPTDPTSTEPSACVFDPAAACACLSDAGYVCNDELTGFEFVEPPASCIDVYLCPATE